MVKNIKSEISKILKEKQDNNGNIKADDLRDFCYIINSFSKMKMFDEAKKAIKHTLNFQDKKGFFKIYNNYISPIYFLEMLYNYIYFQENKEEIKKYIKPIRRSIEYFERNFDENYLLFYRFDKKDRKVFDMKENGIYLEIIDYIAEVLNMYDYNRDADKLFLLKNKVDLGFKRYFFFKKENIMLKRILPQEREFKILRLNETLDILYYLKVDGEFRKSIFLNLKKNILKEKKIHNILYYLIELKNTKNKSFKRELKKYEKYFKEFGNEILNKSEIKNFEVLNKSLFDYTSNPLEITKDKYIIDLHNPKTIFLYLDLI